MVLRTGPVRGCDAYTAVADKIIADMTRHISFLNYNYNVFIPLQIAYIQSWVGKIYGWTLFGNFFYMYLVFPQAAADVAIKPHRDWLETRLGANHNLGYLSQLTESQDNLNTVTYSKEIQNNFNGIAHVELTGHKDHTHDLVETPDFSVYHMLVTSDLIFDFGTFKSVNPYRLDSGGAVTQGAGVNQVNVAASVCYLNDILTNIGPAVATIVRPVIMSSPDVAFNISSITINSSGAVVVLKGDDGTGFSTVRDAPGGPPKIPATSIEVAQVRVPNANPTIIEATWIRQMPRLSDWSELVKNQDITGFQEGRDRSALIEKLWEYLDYSPNSTVLDLKIQLNVSAWMVFTCKLRGGMDENSVFYLLATECRMTGLAEPLTGTTYRINIGGKGVLTYPSYMDYKCLTWKAVEGRAPEPIPITISFEGRLTQIPTFFGATVEPIKTVLLPSGQNYEIVDGGGYRGDPNGWFELMMAENGQVRGFQTFAGMYYDHPLITGVDTAIPVTDPPQPARNMGPIPLADVEYAMVYCNAKFSYKNDEEDWDHWQFMNEENPTGDCEDWAITHAQLLLDMGNSVTKMHLEWGFRQIPCIPPEYDSDGSELYRLIGHGWLVVDTPDGEVAMDNHVVTTRAALKELYPYEGEYQVNGMTFIGVSDPTMAPLEQAPTPYVQKAVPGYKFHAEILAADSATITYA